MRKFQYLSVVLSAAMLAGCGNEKKKDRDFFTSGDRGADQRAEQRIAKEQQLRGEGEGGKDSKNVKKPLYDRLGGEKGLTAITNDFVTRVLADPRVNWERKGVKSGGVLGIHAKSKEWNPTGENVARMKLHLIQFLSLATGGPAQYDGGDMKAIHAGMNITNPEFDAAIGDLKATLDKAGIAVDEQKELLAVVESTRPQIVEARGN